LPLLKKSLPTNILHQEVHKQIEGGDQRKNILGKKGTLATSGGTFQDTNFLTPREMVTKKEYPEMLGGEKKAINPLTDTRTEHTCKNVLEKIL